MYLLLRPRAHVLHSRTHAGCDRNQGSHGRVVETHGRKDSLMTGPVIPDGESEAEVRRVLGRSLPGRAHKPLVLGFAVS